LHNSALERLAWDSEFLGFSVGRISSIIGRDDLLQALSVARQENMRLVYWSPPSETLTSSTRDEFQTSLIVEQVTYRKLIRSGEVLPITVQGFSVEPFFEPRDSPELLHLAMQAGHLSRYRLDSKFKSDVFPRLYRIWIERSCAREIADAVFVIREAGETIAGMITLSIREHCCSIGLLAVGAAFRRRGLGAALMRIAEVFAGEQLCREISVVTQVQNHDAIRLYEASGFVASERLAWFHFWLNEADRATTDV
jgi:ribosomal protein S18 acetylase RimI-like enzyme